MIFIYLAPFSCCYLLLDHRRNNLFGSIYKSYGWPRICNAYQSNTSEIFRL